MESTHEAGRRPSNTSLPKMFKSKHTSNEPTVLMSQLRCRRKCQCSGSVLYHVPTHCRWRSAPPISFTSINTPPFARTMGCKSSQLTRCRCSSERKIPFAYLVREKNSAQLAVGDDIRLCIGVRWNNDASWSRDQIMCVPKSETRKDLASKVTYASSKLTEWRSRAHDEHSG